MATFGDTSIEAGWNAPGQNGLQVCGTFTPASNGTVTSISGYVRGTGSAGVVPYRFAVYAYTAGAPAAFVGATADQTLAAGAAAAWVSPAASFAVTAGTLYVIGVHAGVNSGDAALEYAYNATGGSFNIEYITQTFVVATPTSPFPASPSTINWESSFYATYTPSGGSPPVNTVAPIVTFTGSDPTQDSTLTSDEGTFTGTDGAITKTDAYYRDAYGSSLGVWGGGTEFAAIPSGDGGTTNPYVMTIADVDCYIACVTTATDANGSTTAVSNVVGPVVACVDPIVVVPTAAPGGFASAPRIDAEPPNNVSTAAYAASLVVKTSKGILVGVTGYNSGGAQFIQIHDAAALPANAAVPIISVRVAATANFSIPFDSLAMRGKTFPTGIVVCNSSTGPAKTIGAADCFIEARYF